MSAPQSLFPVVRTALAPYFVTPDRFVRRGGVGPEQPVWDDVRTYSAEWYRRFRLWHHAEFPEADQSTLDNLDMLVKAAENG